MVKVRKIDENYFWYQSNQNLKKFNFDNDQFMRMFKNQLQLKYRDTVNFDLFRKPKTSYSHHIPDF